MVAIVAAGMSQFGKRDEGILDIAAESALPIVRNYRDDIGLLLVSNAYSGQFNGITGLNDLFTTYLSLDLTASVRIDNTSASGGTAIVMAKSMLDSGYTDSVLLTGVEKMTEKPTREVASVISSLLGPREREAGPSLPSLAGLLAKLYMKRYGVPRESIARVAVKNHRNGALNPLAHIRKETPLEKIMESRIIVDPLRLYEFSPISDGSASLLMVRDADAESFSGTPVYIRGTGFASDSSHITDRGDLLALNAVGNAGRAAIKAAGISKPDIAELHDMASVLEIVESEAIGLFPRGEGWKAVDSGETSLEGEMPINTSGGLNSRGHPIGATGISQVYEAYLQVTGKAGKRQVKDVHNALTLGMAGFGNSAVAIVAGDRP